MQYQASKDIIRKRPFRRNLIELQLVLWVCLDSQTSSKDELADSSRKTTEESIERIVSSNHTVQELNSTNKHEEDHKQINQLGALRGGVQVILPDAQSNLLRRLVVIILLERRARRSCGGSDGGSLGRGRRSSGLGAFWSHSRNSQHKIF